MLAIVSVTIQQLGTATKFSFHDYRATVSMDSGHCETHSGHSQAFAPTLVVSGRVCPADEVYPTTCWLEAAHRPHTCFSTLLLAGGGCNTATGACIPISFVPNGNPCSGRTCQNGACVAGE